MSRRTARGREKGHTGEPVATRDSVMSALRESGDRIRGLGVRRLGLFGSFARGDQKAGSDVDFIVEFEAERKTFDNFMALSFFLEDLLHRRVELVTREALSPYIGPAILEEAQYVSFAA